MSEVNIPLLRKAVEWVEEQAALPVAQSQWDQSAWLIPATESAGDGLRRSVAPRTAWRGGSPPSDPTTSRTPSPQGSPTRTYLAAELSAPDRHPASESLCSTATTPPRTSVASLRTSPGSVCDGPTTHVLRPRSHRRLVDAPRPPLRPRPHRRGARSVSTGQVTIEQPDWGLPRRSARPLGGAAHVRLPRPPDVRGGRRQPLRVGRDGRHDARGRCRMNADGSLDRPPCSCRASRSATRRLRPLSCSRRRSTRPCGSTYRGLIDWPEWERRGDLAMSRMRCQRPADPRRAAPQNDGVGRASARLGRCIDSLPEVADRERDPLAPVVIDPEDRDAHVDRLAPHGGADAYLETADRERRIVGSTRRRPVRESRRRPPAAASVRAGRAWMRRWSSGTRPYAGTGSVGRCRRRAYRCTKAQPVESRRASCLGRSADWAIRTRTAELQSRARDPTS